MSIARTTPTCTVQTTSQWSKKEDDAFAAGRASRDAEVEALKADLKHTEECCVLWATDYGNALKEVEALRADAERLDWLSNNFYSRENLDWITGKVCNKNNMWVFFAPTGPQGNIRTVLDAARKEK